MILAVAALTLGVAVGGCIEAHRHRCPDPVVEHARLMASLGTAIAAARREKARADGHEVVLRAMGRVVAEGGTVAGRVDPRHPSVWKDGHEG